MNWKRLLDIFSKNKDIIIRKFILEEKETTILYATKCSVQPL